MLISVDWLKDYVDINCTIDELCAKLVSIGFEVEEVKYLGENIENVVTGKKLSNKLIIVKNVLLVGLKNWSLILMRTSCKFVKLT